MGAFPQEWVPLSMDFHPHSVGTLLLPADPRTGIIDAKFGFSL